MNQKPGGMGGHILIPSIESGWRGHVYSNFMAFPYPWLTPFQRKRSQLCHWDKESGFALLCLPLTICPLEESMCFGLPFACPESLALNTVVDQCFPMIGWVNMGFSIRKLTIIHTIFNSVLTHNNVLTCIFLTPFVNHLFPGLLFLPFLPPLCIYSQDSIMSSSFNISQIKSLPCFTLWWLHILHRVKAKVLSGLYNFHLCDFISQAYFHKYAPSCPLCPTLLLPSCFLNTHQACS